MNHRLNFPRTLLIVLASLFTLAGFGQQNADETEEARARREKWEQEVLYRLKNDWAFFARYRAENDSLPPLAPGEQRVVFMGNSITEGWKMVHPEFFAQNPNYVDRGISGQTTPQMVLRFRPDVIDLDPAAVVILAGINDIAQNTGPTTLDAILGNLISMCQLAKAEGIPVILCSVLPANRFPWNPAILPADQVIELNAMLRDYAGKANIPYVDYYGPMVDGEKGLKAEYSGDGVHPNLVGYQVMEPLVQKAIQATLAK